MTMLSKISRILSILIAFSISGYILFANTSPFNITRKYVSDDKAALALGPKNRVETVNGVNKQIDNLIYLSSKMPFSFDHAQVKTIFKNQDNDQQILLGYHDQEAWHYNTQVLDYPPLNNLNWPKVGSGPYLYQKYPNYKTVNEFISHPPQNKVVGIFDYPDYDSLQANLSIPNYQPSKAKISINVPLRGKTIMYVYLNNEPFNMSLTKQDLNWYSDPDVAKISVYKDKDKVFDATIDDDGNSTDNHKPGFKQTVNIKNPGPGLPESGVYKVVVDAPLDSLITNITTNLHKLAFEGPIYVAENQAVYGEIVKKTNPTILTTNAQLLNFRSDHEQSNTAMVDMQTIKITQPNQVVNSTNPKPSAAITIPSSDMIVNGSGYIAFSPDQFFSPTPYKILPMNSAEDINQVDYILTNYPGAPEHNGDWLVATRDFDLHDAVVTKGQLSWVLETPSLKENKHTVEYKQIEMTLSKKGWFKQ
jgi:hypothetical protein